MWELDHVLYLGVDRRLERQCRAATFFSAWLARGVRAGARERAGFAGAVVGSWLRKLCTDELARRGDSADLGHDHEAQ